MELLDWGGASSLKRKMERGISNGPPVPGRKGSASPWCISKWGNRTMLQWRHVGLLMEGLGDHTGSQTQPSIQRNTFQLPASAIMLGTDWIWVCISHSSTCFGFDHLTSDPESLASGSSFLLINFPSNQCAAGPQPSLHAVGMTHLPARCFNLVPPELKSLFWKTEPSVTFASQVDKLSLFLSFLLFDGPPSGLLLWIFIMLALFSLLLSLLSFCFLHSSHWRQWAVQRPEFPSPLPARQPPSNSNLRSGP